MVNCQWLMVNEGDGRFERVVVGMSWGGTAVCRQAFWAKRPQLVGKISGVAAHTCAARTCADAMPQLGEVAC